MFNNNQPWKKKKDAEGCLDITMGYYNGVEICELVGIYILSRLSTIIDKNDYDLYRVDRLLLLGNATGQHIHHVRKNTTQIFKDIGFLIGIETN